MHTQRLVYYVLYYGTEHLRLLREKWKEEHCLFIDGTIFIKIVSP